MLTYIKLSFNKYVKYENISQNSTMRRPDANQAYLWIGKNAYYSYFSHISLAKLFFSLQLCSLWSPRFAQRLAKPQEK